MSEKWVEVEVYASGNELSGIQRLICEQRPGHNRSRLKECLEQRDGGRRKVFPVAPVEDG